MRPEFALNGGTVAHEKDPMAILPGCIDRAFHFRRRGFVAPHRVYCNGDHRIRSADLTDHSVVVSITSRPLYCPQLGQTRWGTLGSWQLGHSAWAGLLSASWARRFCVRALECLRFGFGILFLRPYYLLNVQIFQSHPAIVTGWWLTRAARFVTVRTADRADTFAGIAAYPLHRELQNNLLPHDIFQFRPGNS